MFSKAAKQREGTETIKQNQTIQDLSWGKLLVIYICKHLNGIEFTF